MTTTSHILTANRLADGEVVYWRRGSWVEALGAADVFPDESMARQALGAADASVRERIVVNPYLFAVRSSADGVRPVEEREIIRAAGPTTRMDLGKQSRHVPL